MEQKRRITKKYFQKQSKWVLVVSLILLVLTLIVMAVIAVAIIHLNGILDIRTREVNIVLTVAVAILVPVLMLIAFIIYLAWSFYHSDIIGMALRDPLTGCFNRNYFDEFYHEQERLFFRYGHDFSLAIIDIDNFKLVNDRMGHDIGDLVLKELVQHIRKNIRSSDILARLGGEEFVVLFTGIGINEGIKVAQEMLESIDGKKDFSCGHMTVSMGIASMKQLETSTDTLLKKADRCLYRAKESGRNQVNMS